MAAAKAFEEDGGFSAYNSASVQILTVDLLEEMLESLTESFMERLDETLDKVFIYSVNNETELEEEVEGKNKQLKAPVENGMDIFSIKDEKLLGFKVINLPRWREIYIEVQIQMEGKILGKVGVFKISRRISTETLQFLYKNGLSTLIKEMCFLKGSTLRLLRDYKIKLQMNTPELANVREDGGIKQEKEDRKMRWKWKTLIHL